MKRQPTNEQIKIIKGISMEMLKMAHNVSGLDYGDCKRILNTHLLSLYQK